MTLRGALVAAALAVAAAGAGAGCTGGNHQPALVTYGHSYVSGIPGAVKPWPEQAAQAAGLPLDNHGHSGDTSDQILQQVRDHPPGDGDVVVIEAEINDVIRNGEDGLDAYRQNLDTMLGLVEGHRVIVVGDPPIRSYTSPQFGLTQGSPEALTSYSQASAEEAAAHGATFVDLGDGWDVDTMTGPDGLHPNDQGVAAIAQKVAAAISEGA